MMAVAVCAMLLAGGGAAWHVSQVSGQEAMRRVVAQQTDEVEVIARLLASKMEQSQKVLRAMADGVTPHIPDADFFEDPLHYQGLPALGFFDAVQVVGSDGAMLLNLRSGRAVSAASLEPAERDVLRRTLADGKPQVSELIAGGTGDARVTFTMPLHRDDGSVLGAVGGALKLQSQSLLPPSMALPERDESRLVVFSREGTILSHSDPSRVLGNVRDEPGLSVVYAQWLQQAQPLVGRGETQVLPDHIVSLAGMPLPQWMVARVSHSRALLAPLAGAQREAWWVVAGALAVGSVALLALLGWMAQPLARLRLAAQQLLRAHARTAAPWPQGRGADHEESLGESLGERRAPGQSAKARGRAKARDDSGELGEGSAPGELAEVARALEQLARQGSRHAEQQSTLGKQFQAILDHASVGIVITRHGVLEVLGHQVCLMLGYDCAELQGQPARTLYASADEYARTGARVQAEFAVHGAFDGDVCFMRKDGSPLWARVQGRGVGSMGGGTVWILEDITAMRQAQQLKTWSTAHDALTQLYNRAAFDERLGALLAERAARVRDDGAQPPAGAPGEGVVLFMDLDHFTVVNDLAGHDAGDDALRHVARLLESQVRHMGWAARVGGDEFAVVLPGCALARGQAVAEQLRQAVQAWAPSYQGSSFTLSMSIGLVALDASLPDVASVLYSADMACYDAKRAGRNRVETGRARDMPASGRMALGSV
jgi:diguanylate cyclase (GGDEF)-like protein/PAS domain S-box-containing protein